MKSKLMLGGRRNLMDTIDNLKTTKNKLVVLNPVMEDLQEVVEVKPDKVRSPDIIEITPKYRNDMSDILEVVKETSKSSASPRTGSCFCCPTLECRNKPKPSVQTSQPSVQSKPQHTLHRSQKSPAPPVEPVSQLDQAIASISSDSQTQLNPHSGHAEKVVNKPGGVGFMELDKAIASIAELQNSFLGAERGSQMEGPGSPFFEYGEDPAMNVFEENLAPTINQSVNNMSGMFNIL